MLDSVTERDILQDLNAMRAGRTTIMIAHRLSTVREVDEILVLDHGRIVERGNHAGLLKRGEFYAAMWQAQVRDQPA
jgi:ATP-binding cassette subfamily B protein